MKSLRRTLAGILLSIAFLASANLSGGGELLIRDGSCEASFDPATLAIRLRQGDRPPILLSSAQARLGKVVELQRAAAAASWTLPERNVSIALRLEDQSLLVHVLATEPGEFTFPIIPEAEGVKGWILPFFEGVYAPRGDERWASFLTNRGELNTTADLTLPFVGLDGGSFTVTCILTNPFNNRLQFCRTLGKVMEARLTHEFTRNHPVKEYGVVFQLGTNSPVEPARCYRQWLLRRGEFVSLAEKIRTTPEAARLPGAAHAYVWGQWRELIPQLREAGLDRLWLGSDSWEVFVKDPAIVSAAKQAGFLIGPYDSYHSIHRPGEPGTWETAQFDVWLYKTGAIIKVDGSPRRGFKQKGYLLSPDAARPYVEQRVSRLMAAFPANSWFVDCDGFGDYFDDYSPAHPATQQSDMQARIARMAWIRDRFGSVIGTEGCSAGVAPTIHFAHGVLTPVIGWGDPDLTNRQSKYYLGGWYPPDGPKVFFKPVPMKEEYRYIYYNPRFRLPLFQTVFHDSVIATHHWSFGSLKAQDEARMVELLELLYQVPPLYHLNEAEFRRRKAQMKRHYQFFSPLHRESALLPMTEFEWLAADGTVQRTVFGDKLELVANFGAGEFQYRGAAVAPRSILARHRDSAWTQLYVP